MGSLMPSGLMKIFGHHDEATIQQLKRCAAAERDAPAVLCADGHLGYSMPIGGVVAYRDHVVAVRRRLRHRVRQPGGADAPSCAPRPDAGATTAGSPTPSQRRVSFGMGRRNDEPIRDHPVFDAIAQSPVTGQRRLLGLAREQLGTVGSGNHYVDVLEDEAGRCGSACTSDRAASATRPPPDF